MLGILLAATVLSLIFEDVTEEMGIAFPHHASYLITGQAFADVNRDGWVDIILTSNDGENGIFLNQQGADFVPAPFSSDIRMPGHQSGGVAIADYNNDGWQDIFIAGFGTNHLFRNDGGSGFTDVTAIAGVNHEGRDESAAWGDFNGDGWLDLMVVGFPLPDHPEPFDPVNLDALYFNNGDGTFADMSHTLDRDETRGPGFAVSIFDFDSDGDADMYVVNDKLFGNALWRNDGPGCGGWCFVDVAEQTNTRRPVYGMGISVADYDNDLDEDLLFSSISEQVLLSSQWSQGQQSYIDVSDEAGVSLDAVGWATLFLDMDNDGWQDAFIATFNDAPENADRVYLNQQNGTFIDVSADSGASDGRPTIGAASGDYNNDGLLDLLVGDHGEGFRLLQNTTSNTNRFVQFTLLGGGDSNPDGIGTVIWVTRDNGETTRHRMFSGDAIGSGSQLLTHVGIGSSDGVDVSVRWPDGTQQEWSGLVSGHRHLLVHRAVEIISRHGFEDEIKSDVSVFHRNYQ